MKIFGDDRGRMLSFEFLLEQGKKKRKKEKKERMERGDCSRCRGRVTSSYNGWDGERNWSSDRVGNCLVTGRR